MAKVGKKPLFNESEEKDFVDHLTYMTDAGYGYTKSSIQTIAKILCLVLDTDNKIGVISAITGFIILRAGGHNELKIVKS